MNCNSRNKLFKQLSLPIKNELFDSITKFSTQINTLPNIFGIKSGTRIITALWIQ